VKTTRTFVVLDGSIPTPPATALTQSSQDIVISEGEYGEIVGNFVGENGQPFPVAGYTSSIAVRKTMRAPVPLISRGGNPTGVAQHTWEILSGDTVGRKGANFWDGFLRHTATGKPYRFVEASRFYVADAVTDLGDAVTLAGPGQRIIGLTNDGREPFVDEFQREIELAVPHADQNYRVPVLTVQVTDGGEHVGLSWVMGDESHFIINATRSFTGFVAWGTIP
jgi:hypothetical protein